MTIHQMIKQATLTPETAKIVTTAIDRALKALYLDRSNPLAEIVAKRIIERAWLGLRDPVQLRELATAGMR
jgi:hypothetical protein